ncbi:MAG: hypothetical protein OXF32_12875 [Anaerolineaceae bacterium]|nr:hypothetical protein [Anaerolineaceae bacterium]
MNTETVTIRRIGPTSALKFGAVVGLVVGVLYFVLALFSVIEIRGTVERLVMLVMFLFIGVLAGGLSGLVGAWVYNIALNLTGGLQLEVSFGRDEKDGGVPPAIGSMMSHDE